MWTAVSAVWLLFLVAFLLLIARILIKQAKALYKMRREPSARYWWSFLPVLGMAPLIVRYRLALIPQALKNREDRLAKGLSPDLRTKKANSQTLVKSHDVGVGLCTWGWSCLHPFMEPAIDLCDPACVEHMLKTSFEKYEKGDLLKSVLSDLLGDGIFNSDGLPWHAQRKTASHLFKGANMKRYFLDVFNSHIGAVVQTLEHSATSTTLVSSSAGSVDVQDLFMRFTLDSIGQIAFGRNIESLLRDVPFSQSFNEAQMCSERRLMSVPLLSIFNELSLKKAVRTLDRFAYQMVDERVASKNAGELDYLQLPEGKLKETDLLTRYVLSADGNGQPFSRKFLRDTVMNFMIAGRDTTGKNLNKNLNCVTMAWAIHLLAAHADIQSRLREELFRVSGRNATCVPSHSEIKSCALLEAVIKETLRLFPPVPIDVKQCIADDVLPCGMSVPRGASVSWSAFFLGRYSEYWENADQFDPDRWLRGDPRLCHASQWAPFQLGPRVCIGMRMALLESSAVLSVLLRKFEFLPDESHEVQMRFAILLSSSNGIRIRVKSI